MTHTIHALVEGFHDRWTFRDPTEAAAYFSYMKRERMSPESGQRITAAIIFDDRDGEIEGFTEPR